MGSLSLSPFRKVCGSCQILQEEREAPENRGVIPPDLGERPATRRTHAESTRLTFANTLRFGGEFH